MAKLFENLSLVLIVLLACRASIAQDYSTSIVGTDFDIITDNDPSSFVKLEYQGVRSAEMPDKTSAGELFRKAHILQASFGDKTTIDIAIDSQFETAEAAETEALRYAIRLGKLPRVLRSGVQRLVVHHGKEDTTAFSDQGLIVIYSANATKRIETNDLEETLFHESVHAAWDLKYAKSADWKRAQVADGTFATMYAKRKPELEDLAESTLLAFAVIHHVDRLPPKDAERIQRAIPARIQFIERLIPIDKPLF